MTHHLQYGGADLHRRLRIYYGLKLFTLAMAFLFQILVAKLLSPQNYATYAILLAILIAAERILSFGIDRTILRFVPPLTSRGGFADLGWLLKRLALVRVFSICLMLLAIYFGASIFQDALPNPATTVYAYAGWYISFALTTDADMLAQSWLAHVQIALIVAFEVFTRSLAVAACAAMGYGDAGTIIGICAITGIFALGIISISGVHILIKGNRIRLLSLNAASNQYPDIKVRSAPIFAAAAYSSNLGWLISSPVVVRLFARGGLDIFAFAAFSFVQGLCVSLQRGLPGQLVLPSLEPVLAKYSGSGQKSVMFTVLSLVFKIELILSFSIIIVTAIAGQDIISFLSRPAYASYFMAFPGLMIVLILQAAYRICETVLSTLLKNAAFIALWPISLLSVFMIYLTAAKWGVWSVIGIPIGEGLLRIVLLGAIYRRETIWLAFDPTRLFQLTASTIAALAGGSWLKLMLGDGTSNVTVAGMSILIWTFLILIVRPLRLAEVETLSVMLPNSMRVFVTIASFLARP